MRKTTLKIAAIISLVVAAKGIARSEAAPAPSAKADAGTAHGFLISIQHKPIGRMSYYLSPIGAKFVSPLVNMIVTPKEEGVILYANNKYAVYKDPRAVTRIMLGYAKVSKDSHSYKPWKKLERTKLKGMPCDHYVREMVDPPKNEREHKTSTFSEHVWLVPMGDFKIPHASKMFTPIVHAFEMELPAEGIPLQHASTWTVYEYGKVKHADNVKSETCLVCEHVDVSKKDFMVPSSFKRVHSDTELMYG
ncbi:MAG: hypothetical protein ACRD3W_21730, partial [Terriglobales bacterium]